MAIEPKSPRKRAVKKSSKKSLSAGTTPEPTESVAEEVAPAKSKATTKKAAAIPVPIFQAAPVEAAPKKAAKASAKKSAKADKSEEVEEVSTPAAASDSEESESRGNRNRRRRRGGRGRRKPNGEGVDSQEDSENDSEDSTNDSTENADGTTHRRRRRRRATGEGVTPGEVIDEDGVVPVVKVREVREKTERPSRDRSERGTRNRRDRDRGRNDSRDYREPYRRRGTIITDGEFLARRENVDREMVVRQIGDRIQIGVIEDKVMVEHYVNRNANVSYVGNVYLGRVQNVLPSMEAAFVDIGKGRNAVLYAGEVNWDAAGISES